MFAVLLEEPDMSTTPPPPPPPRPPAVHGSGPPSADPPARSAPPGGGRRAVAVLSALSIVLAMALVAMSIAWWRARDAAADDAAPRPSTEPEPSPPATAAAPDTSPGAEDDGQPAPTPPEEGEAPAVPGPAPEGDVLDDLGRMLDDLLSGDLGALGDLGDIGDLGGLGDDLAKAGALSPECLGGGLDELLGSALGGDELSGPLDDQVREIAERVQQQRGLRFDRPVEPVLLPAAEFDRRIAVTVAAEYPASQADAEARVLALLGVLPAGTDLRELQADLLAGQVAGFYDPETGEIVVRDDGDGALDTTEEMTLAHELDHALTDQALGLPDVTADGQSDGDLARLALVEGDATLLMQQYALAHVGLLDQLGQLADPAMRTAQAELADVPPYLREELTFPYLAGAAYVCRMYADGGWPAVDAAYDAPPATTAEVLSAERAGTVDDRAPRHHRRRAARLALRRSRQRRGAGARRRGRAGGGVGRR